MEISVVQNSLNLITFPSPPPPHKPKSCFESDSIVITAVLMPCRSFYIYSSIALVWIGALSVDVCTDDKME